MDKKTKEALQKQLQLLSERSAFVDTTEELVSITRAMAEIVAVMPMKYGQ